MKYSWHTAGFTELSCPELYRILWLRQQVFVIEQACLYQDLDGLDQYCTHMQCLQEDELIAYQRCLPPGLSYPQSSLGRIAVAPSGRGQQLGRELVQRGIRFNLAQWPGSGITIAAQSYLRSFYTSLGFAADGPEYLEDGIAHLKMRYCP